MVRQIKITHINSEWDRCDIYYEEVNHYTKLYGVLNEFYVYKNDSRYATMLRDFKLFGRY